MTFFAMKTGNANLNDLRRAARVALFFALVFGGSACFAQSELARYIAPDTPVLAGMRQVPSNESGDLLWLATSNNAADLAQLVKVTADDPARQLDEVIATDSASGTDGLGNHLLLAKGQFDFGKIAAAERAHGAKEMKYRGVRVLVLDALQGGRGPQWFAVLKHDVAMLGTPAAVAQALDRSIEHAEADARIVERLRNIPRRDAAWSSIAVGSGQVQSHLSDEMARVKSCMGSTQDFVLGIDPGATMEIDMKTASGAESAACLSNAIFGEGARLVRTAATTNSGTLKVKLAREEYEHWLSGFGRRVNQLIEAMVSPSGIPAAAGLGR